MADTSNPVHATLRRSRWWLWTVLAGFVLLALAAVPGWRYYWHTEYRNHIRAISRNPRDSYHELPPWSILASVPRSFQPLVSRLRTVDLNSDDSRALTAADLRRLNEIVRYRQFGLGLQRLCLTDAPVEIWDGLAGYDDLLYLKLDRCHLPVDAGSRLSRLTTLNVLSVVGEPDHYPGRATRDPRLQHSPESQRELTRQIRESETRQRTGIDSLWEAPQLEELSLRIPRPVTLSGHDFRKLRELHRLALHSLVSRDELVLLADLPALRSLDLGGVRVDWQQLTVESLADWRQKLAELRRRRPAIDLMPPGLPTEEALVRWRTETFGIRILRSQRRLLTTPSPDANLPPTFAPDAQ